MPLPNPKISKAIFASYFQIRHDTWGLVDSDEPILPTDPKALLKIEVCYNFLKQFDTASTFHDWLAIIYDLAEKEKVEDLTYTGKRFLGLASYFVDRPLLLLTLRAIRSYIISQLKDEPAFKDAKARLQDELINLKGRIVFETENNTSTKESLAQMDALVKTTASKLAALNDEATYHHTYFTEVIMRRDFTAKVSNLNENKFDDFQHNVNEGLRKLDLLDKICDAWVKKKTPLSTPAVPATASSPATPTAPTQPVQEVKDPLKAAYSVEYPTLDAAYKPKPPAAEIIETSTKRSPAPQPSQPSPASTRYSTFSRKKSKQSHYEKRTQRDDDDDQDKSSGYGYATKGRH